MHFFRTRAYTGLYVNFKSLICAERDPVMDECVTTTATAPVLTTPVGDVDDLIFLHFPEWNVSER